jgi:hypothetical protein
LIAERPLDTLVAITYSRSFLIGNLGIHGKLKVVKVVAIEDVLDSLGRGFHSLRGNGHQSIRIII